MCSWLFATRRPLKFRLPRTEKKGEEHPTKASEMAHSLRNSEEGTTKPLSEKSRKPLYSGLGALPSTGQQCQVPQVLQQAETALQRRAEGN